MDGVSLVYETHTWCTLINIHQASMHTWSVEYLIICSLIFIIFVLIFLWELVWSLFHLFQPSPSWINSHFWPSIPFSHKCCYILIFFNFIVLPTMLDCYEYCWLKEKDALFCCSVEQFVLILGMHTAKHLLLVLTKLRPHHCKINMDS